MRRVNAGEQVVVAPRDLVN